MTLTVESVFKQADAADADAALVPPNGNMGGKTVYRLGKGVGRLLTTDTNAPPEKLAKTNAEIPVMLDVFTAAPMMATFNHIPGGSNVLFLDGHVAFYKYPGTGPVSRPVGLLFGILETIKRCTP
jgi:prepilin-type processing-associated H-X9-DG protein